MPWVSVTVHPVDANANKWNLIARAGPECPGAGGRPAFRHGSHDPQRWSSDPFIVSERGDRWYGLGICDI